MSTLNKELIYLTKWHELRPNGTFQWNQDSFVDVDKATDRMLELVYNLLDEGIKSLLDEGVKLSEIRPFSQLKDIDSIKLIDKKGSVHTFMVVESYLDRTVN